MGLTTDALADLMIGTLPKFDKQVAQTQKRTEYRHEMFFSGSARKQISGESNAFYIRVREGQSTRFVDLFEGSPLVTDDVTVRVDTKLRHIDTASGFDLKEDEMNQGESQIIDHLRERRLEKWAQHCDRIEEELVLPPLNATSSKSLWGIPAWIRTLNLNEVDAVGGFNGRTTYFRDGTSTTRYGFGSAAPDAALPSNDRLKNFAGTHSGTVDKNLIRLIRRAVTRTGFKTMAGLTGDTTTAQGDRFVLMCGHALADGFEDMASDAADDPAGDLGMEKAPRVRGNRIERWPALDDIAYMPIYGLRVGMQGVRGIVLGNRFKRWSKPMADPAAPDTVRETLQSSINIGVSNPRQAGFVLHLVRTAA